MTDTASLELPATAGHVAIARAFAAGMLRSAGYPDERVSAARLAVSELVSAAIAAGASRVRIEVSSEGARSIVDVSADADSATLSDLAHRIVDDAGIATRRSRAWSLSIAAHP